MTGQDDRSRVRAHFAQASADIEHTAVRQRAGNDRDRRPQAPGEARRGDHAVRVADDRQRAVRAQRGS